MTLSYNITVIMASEINIYYQVFFIIILSDKQECPGRGGDNACELPRRSDVSYVVHATS